MFPPNNSAHARIEEHHETNRSSGTASEEAGGGVSRLNPRDGKEKVQSMSETELTGPRKAEARMRWGRSVRKAVTAQRFVNDLQKRGETYLYADEQGSVTNLVTLLFALPQFSLIPLTLLINVQIILYYNEIGVTLGFIAFFQIFARSFDVLTDPLMAHMSDNKTHTRCGRRIPYVILAPLYSIAFYVLVTPPTDNPNLATAWFGFSYIIFYLMDTVVNVPFQALGPELSDDPDARSSLYMWVKVAEGLGVLAGTGMPFVLLLLLPKAFVYQLMAVVFGVWYIVSMYAVAFIIKERPASLVIQSEQDQEFVPTILRALRNEAFRPLLFGWMLDFAALALIASMLPFWVTYYVQIRPNPESFMSLALAVLFVCQFLAIPVWRFLSLPIVKEPTVWHEKLRIGKYYAWLSYNALLLLTNFTFFAVGKGSSKISVLIVTGINGFPFGGQFLIQSILADVIDYDELLNFTRNEGSFTVFATFIPKLVSIPAQSLPLVIMFFLGFKSPQKIAGTKDKFEFQEQPQVVVTFIQMAFVSVPAVFTLTSFIIKKKLYPIRTKEIMAEISKGVAVHMEGKPAMDPITNKIITIEKYNAEEQIIVTILDHFMHYHLLWLLNPHIIIERFRDDQQLSKSGEENLYGEAGSGCCGTNESSEEPFQIMKNAQGEIDHVRAHDFAAYGAERGTQMLINRQRMFVMIYAVTVLSASISTILTFNFLREPTLAIVPAFCSLFVGLGTFGGGFSYLRLQAAHHLMEVILAADNPKKRADLEELFARVIYPKTKGQRGGADLDGPDLQDIQRLVPRPAATKYRELDGKAVREFEKARQAD